MGALDAFGALMAELYLPILSEAGSWGSSTDQHSHAFLKSAIKLTSTLTEAAATSAASVELMAPDQASAY
ncbi:g6081 [Coccomyxa elongata]